MNPNAIKPGLNPDDPRHGSLAGYKIHRCRCPRCRTANRDYNNRYNRLNAYGRWQPMVDAEPVRQHINALRAAGLGVQRIADLAGVGNSTVQHLVWRHHAGRPPTKRLRSEVAAALLAVQATPDVLAGGAFVDATGTRRRIQALVAFGWPLAEQARRLRRSLRNFRDLLTQKQVTARTAREVADLYEQMSATPPPAGWVTTRTRRFAARNGWEPPLAWDDIDDPDATPNTDPADDEPDIDEVLVRRALAGHAPLDTLNEPERIALWKAWIAHRNEYAQPTPGLADFARIYKTTTLVAERFRNLAEGLNSRGKPRKTTTTSSSAASGRTSERTAA